VKKTRHHRTGLDRWGEEISYAAAFYGNLGNYKSFGDTKFVPALPPHKMKMFLLAGAADAAKVEAVWAECGARMYSLPPRQRQIGLGAEKGVST
jgi:dipeptidyl-peptidase-3